MSNPGQSSRVYQSSIPLVYSGRGQGGSITVLAVGAVLDGVVFDVVVDEGCRFAVSVAGEIGIPSPRE